MQRREKSIRTGSVCSKASGEATTDSSGAHWLSFGANALRWSSLCAPTSNSPHWSSLGASMSNSPGSSSVLDQPPTVLGASSAAPFEKLLLVRSRYACVRELRPERLRADEGVGGSKGKAPGRAARRIEFKGI